MSAEQSRITCVDKNSGRELGELRNALRAFPGAARPENGEQMDGVLVKEAAQRVVNAMRDEIHDSFFSQPNDQQERYYREVLKTVADVSDKRFVFPTYEQVIEGSSEDCDVSIVRPLDQGSVLGSSFYSA